MGLQREGTLYISSFYRKCVLAQNKTKTVIVDLTSYYIHVLQSNNHGLLNNPTLLCLLKLLLCLLKFLIKSSSRFTRKGVYSSSKRFREDCCFETCGCGPWNIRGGGKTSKSEQRRCPASACGQLDRITTEVRE